MATDDEAATYVSVGTAAELLHVSPKTVGRWADTGKIPCFVTLGGHRRFRLADVLAAADRMSDEGRHSMGSAAPAVE